MGDEKNHEFEQLDHTYFDLFGDLYVISEYVLSKFYHYFFDDGNYIVSSRATTWYHYDDNDILKESTTKQPFKLKHGMRKNLDNYFRQL